MFSKRLQAKCLLLTYFVRNATESELQQKNMLNPEFIKQELWRNNSETIEYIVVGQEVCPETKRIHAHVFIVGKSGGKFRFSTDEKFYIRDLTNPNIKIVTPHTSQQVIRYVKKDGNWVESGELPIDKPNSKRVYGDALTKLNDSTMSNQQRIDSAMAIIFNGDPESWSKQGHIIRKNYEHFVGRELHKNNYDLESCINRLNRQYAFFRSRWHNRIAEELQKDEKSIVIRGPSGCGKTEYACALIGHSYCVNKLEALRGFNMERGIVFDDFKIAYSEAESWIALFDRKHDRQIRVLYGVVDIPKGTRKIFTTNRRKLMGDDESALCKCLTDEHRVAIGRRVLDVNLYPDEPEEEPKKKKNKNSLWLHDHNTYVVLLNIGTPATSPS